MGARTYRTVLIGTGNVATFLSNHIVEPFEVTCVGGRQRICSMPMDADLYIIAVSDRSIPEVAEELQDVSGLVVHTAGSVAMDAIRSVRKGVFYPLQTLSKSRPIEPSRVPFYIEAEREEDLVMLRLLAETMGATATPLSSEQRRYLHLSAVFCCNFVNRLYGITANILEEHDIPFSVVLPLIDETARKVSLLTPRQAQTGPAMRWDEEVMDRHKAMLPEQERAIYELISKSIHDDKLRLEKD